MRARSRRMLSHALAAHLTRRCFVASLWSLPVLAARGEDSAGEARRFLDATTEFEILRVTDLAHNSWLPFAENRAFSRRADFLIFASDRDGAPQLYRHEIRTNKLKQLTQASALNPEVFTLTAADRQLFYIDGNRILQLPLNNLREHQLHEFPGDLHRGPRLATNEAASLIVASSSDGSKTRIVHLARSSSTLAEVPGPITRMAIRPQGRSLLFLTKGELHILEIDTRKDSRCETAPGEVLDAIWSPDGTSVLYLSRPPESNRLNEIREFIPTAPANQRDSFIAKTSQFVHLRGNSDGSVFLGASSSKASPNILLLVRSVRRELTICEHRCSDASLTHATFSPTSTRIAFQTDRHGKMVIYLMNVEKLVEQTEEA